MSSAEPSRGEPAPVEAEALAAWAGAALGVPVTSVERVPAGIGLRAFYRLRFRGGPGTAIARVDAPEDPAGRPAGSAPEPPLEPVRALLERAGLPVPRRYAADPRRGVELLEDGGPESLCERFARALPGERSALVAAALELVPRIQRVRDDGSGVAAFGRRLDAALFRYKAELFADVSLAAALRRAPRPAERAVVTDAFDWIARHCERAPQRLAHRDFQSHNLLVRHAPGAEPALLLIDLQGAFLAPPEYDLVCLLRDSYLGLEEALVLRERERIRPLLPDAPAADELALRFDLLTLTRKGKDHARFLVAEGRGETRYRRYVAPTVAMLRAASARTRDVASPLGRLDELIAELPEEPPCAR
jgi:aminoglycoside/choline kinase family phosphotransferase